MKRSMKKLIITLAAITAASFMLSIIILYSTGGIGAVSVQTAQIRSSEVFLADEVEHIRIKTIDSRVSVVPVVDKKISIDFYGRRSTNLSGFQPELITGLNNGVLTIEISHPRTINIGLINLENLYLDVYVPDNFSGRISVETVSGNFDIRRLALEELRHKSISGNIEADNLYAKNINIEMTSGNTNLRDVKGNIAISSISGQVEIILNWLEDDINIKTVSGKTDIFLPAESEFDFNLSSISGNISNEFAALIKYSDSKRLEGSAGNGASEIIVNTISGNINLKKEVTDE